MSEMFLSAGEIALRLLGAMLIGMVIGTEREYTHRPAGMRTHMLVAIGSCAVMVTSQLLFHQYWVEYGTASDPARLSAQVIAGVGFLGAGTIMREGFSVKGLTTAASIWSVACLGIAVGAGYYELALIGTLCIFITLTVFDWLQKKLLRVSEATYHFTVSCCDVAQALERINVRVAECGAEVSSIEVHAEEKEHITINFNAKFSGRDVEKKLQKFVTDISMEEVMTSVCSTCSQK